MKVILIKDVQNLGSAGDIKDVADGYARNFLIPSGYADIATQSAIKQSEEIKIKKAKQAEDELKTAEELSGKLEGVAVKVMAKADESGKLYAAVKAEEISKSLEEKGFKVDKNKIVIKEPIKEIGECEVIVTLEHGLEARLNLTVEAEK
jgi:large subunit ribosomal protein L9